MSILMCYYSKAGGKRERKGFEFANCTVREVHIVKWLQLQHFYFHQLNPNVYLTTTMCVYLYIDMCGFDLFFKSKHTSGIYHHNIMM